MPIQNAVMVPFAAALAANPLVFHLSGILNPNSCLPSGVSPKACSFSRTTWIAY